jgi:hypothetical protein
MNTWHLAHPSLPRPSGARITALSGAMFVNALALARIFHRGETVTA